MVIFSANPWAPVYATVVLEEEEEEKKGKKEKSIER
jgi:hypothetical protein